MISTATLFDGARLNADAAPTARFDVAPIRGRTRIPGEQAQPARVAAGPRSGGGLDGKRRANTEMARASALFVLSALAIVFAVLNLEDVKVDWAFGSGDAPLIVVIVISLLVGIVLTYSAERRVARGWRARKTRADGGSLLGHDLDRGLGADERREHDIGEVVGERGEQLDAPAGHLAADGVPERAGDALDRERRSAPRSARPR